jgi:hypothetical protein
MTTFDDRERAFEAKFAHDEEFRFLVIARRDKLYARWAATRARLSGEQAESLVHDVLAIPNSPGHDEAVLKHVGVFLGQHGRGLQRHELTAALEACAKDARTQLLELPPGHPEAP